MEEPRLESVVTESPATSPPTASSATIQVQECRTTLIKKERCEGFYKEGPELTRRVFDFPDAAEISDSTKSEARSIYESPSTDLNLDPTAADLDNWNRRTPLHHAATTSERLYLYSSERATDGVGQQSPTEESIPRSSEVERLTFELLGLSISSRSGYARGHDSEGSLDIGNNDETLFGLSEYRNDGVKECPSDAFCRPSTAGGFAGGFCGTAGTWDGSFKSEVGKEGQHDGSGTFPCTQGRKYKEILQRTRLVPCPLKNFGCKSDREFDLNSLEWEKDLKEHLDAHGIGEIFQCLLRDDNGRFCEFAGTEKCMQGHWKSKHFVPDGLRPRRKLGDFFPAVLRCGECLSIFPGPGHGDACLDLVRSTSNSFAVMLSWMRHIHLCGSGGAADAGNSAGTSSYLREWCEYLWMVSESQGETSLALPSGRGRNSNENLQRAQRMYARLYMYYRCSPSLAQSASGNLFVARASDTSTISSSSTPPVISNTLKSMGLAGNKVEEYWRELAQESFKCENALRALSASTPFGTTSVSTPLGTTSASTPSAPSLIAASEYGNDSATESQFSRPISIHQSITTPTIVADTPEGFYPEQESFFDNGSASLEKRCVDSLELRLDSDVFDILQADLRKIDECEQFG